MRNKIIFVFFIASFFFNFVLLSYLSICLVPLYIFIIYTLMKDIKKEKKHIEAMELLSDLRTSLKKEDSVLNAFKDINSSYLSTDEETIIDDYRDNYNDESYVLFMNSYENIKDKNLVIELITSIIENDRFYKYNENKNNLLLEIIVYSLLLAIASFIIDLTLAIEVILFTSIIILINFILFKIDFLNELKLNSLLMSYFIQYNFVDKEEASTYIMNNNKYFQKISKSKFKTSTIEKIINNEEISKKEIVYKDTLLLYSSMFIQFISCIMIFITIL